MLKKLFFSSLFCAFLLAGQAIEVVPQDITKTIKEDILLIYEPLLYDVKVTIDDIKSQKLDKVSEKKGQIIVVLDSKESVGQRDFEQMVREIKQKIAVLLQKDATIRYNAAGKLLHEM